MSTREAILEAALSVFAESGYDLGTVREICQRADANVAAVNYHFGDKATLYEEVLQYAYRSAGTGEPMPRLSENPTEPLTQLRRWIHWYLRRLLQAGQTEVGRLMAREMASPTPALDALASRAVQPVFSELNDIVQAVTEGRLNQREIRLHSTSIVGQCLIYRSGSAMLERLDPPHFGIDDAIEIADHIAAAACAALSPSFKGSTA